MFFQSRFQASESPSRALVSCFKYSSENNGTYPLHCHSYYEMCYILRGERYELYRGDKYRVGEGTLFLVPPLAVHGNENITEVDDVILQFSTSLPGMFSTDTPADMKLVLNSEQPYTDIEKDSASHKILLSLVENSDEYVGLYQQEEHDVGRHAALEYKRGGLVLELIAALLDEKKIMLCGEASNITKLMAIDKVIEHITTHIDNIPDMTTAAQMAEMNYYGFSRLFKEAAGMTYSEYCNAIRIGYAENLLINTDDAIADIGLQIGIDTPSYFTKLFRQLIGCSPAEYRRIYKKRS